MQISVTENSMIPYWCTVSFLWLICFFNSSAETKTIELPSYPSGVYLIPSFGTYSSVASFCLILCFNFCVLHKWLHFLILEKRSDIEDSLRVAVHSSWSELYSLGVPFMLTPWVHSVRWDHYYCGASSQPSWLPGPVSCRGCQQLVEGAVIWLSWMPGPRSPKTVACDWWVGLGPNVAGCLAWGVPGQVQTSCRRVSPRY